MQNLTFEQLPAAVALLLEKIERIEKLLSGMEAKSHQSIWTFQKRQYI